MKNSKMNLENIEYVIYCRKSSDESSGNQKQSIPDQIEACMKYAENECLKLMWKPTDFSDFETISDLKKEDLDKSQLNRDIYQKTRNLYIIKEQETAKIEYKRPKWRKLISLVKKWKIKGILSYAPDRQARNMLEWWELITLVDNKRVALKYSDFQFEDSPSGKMMLWIWFTLSKQYSDNLSHVITRGTNSKVKSGKAIWRYKAGYRINSYWFHEPDPRYFRLIQEAFQKKLHWVPESIIKGYLDANGYERTYKKQGRKVKISSSMLNTMFQDTFYYGIFKNWSEECDLRSLSSHYMPVVSESDFMLIAHMHEINPITKWKSKVKDDHSDVRAFENDFIKTDDNFNLTFSIPNKYRYQKKIKEAAKRWKILTLSDVMKPHQMVYTCKHKSSKYRNISFSQREIDNEVIKAFTHIGDWKELFKEYLAFCNEELDILEKDTREKVRLLNMQKSRLQTEKKDFIKSGMWAKDVEEQKVYDEERLSYDKKIAVIESEIEELEDNERDWILEYEVFTSMLTNAESYYKRATYVQKGKIAKILFSNIKINTKKRLKIQVKPGLETFFNSSWWS